MESKKTVLIIDDDAEYRRCLGAILEENGWSVLQAAEGEDGIALARQRRPEAVLCDLLMPRCNGYLVCRSLRGDPALRHTRIVVTSGRDYESDRQAALADGADAYLSKPINPSQLVVLLARIVGASETSTPPFESFSKVRLKFWGVRGSIPTPGPSTVHYGGNTSCVEVRADGQLIILDAGTGLRPLGRELMLEFNSQPLEMTLLLTHTHWDHIQGLPFFLPVYHQHNQLRILGYEGARHGLDNVLTSQMENPFFPIGLREVPANVRIEELKEMEFHIGPVRVQACFANHPGVCVGYRLFTSAGSIAFFPDNEPQHGHRPGSKTETTQAARARAYARSEDCKLIDFLRGTDVLIMDAQYDSQEYLQHVGWGHGCLDDIVRLAAEAQVKRLYLFHHDPDHDDAKIRQMTEHARSLAAELPGLLQVEAAREGVGIELPLATSMVGAAASASAQKRG
jgi:phosphoribosyl 1,2-cyclic phosphodiesterase/CheY-like chemotaxis protein